MIRFRLDRSPIAIVGSCRDHPGHLAHVAELALERANIRRKDRAVVRPWGVSSPATRRELGTLRPGTIVAVRVAGVWHEGLLSERQDEDGAPRILHKSKRSYRAEEEPASLFAPDGRELRIVGYIGSRSSEVVVGYARSRIGEPWTVTDNCQRFTRRAHGVPARSPGVEAFFACLLLGFTASS